MNQKLPTITGLRYEDFTRELPGKLAEILEHIWVAPDCDVIKSYRCARDSIEGYFYDGMRFVRVSHEFFENMEEILRFTAARKDDNFQAELLNMFFLALKNIVYINDRPVFSKDWCEAANTFSGFIKGMGALDVRLYFVTERFLWSMDEFPSMWEFVYDGNPCMNSLGKEH